MTQPKTDTGPAPRRPRTPETIVHDPAALDAAAIITEADIAGAQASWARYADPRYRNLLLAVEPDILPAPAPPKTQP